MSVFRSYEEALSLSEQDITMAAANKQPSGPKGGMKAPNTHAPHSGAGTNDGTGTGQGGEVKRGSTPQGTGKNKNRLH
jgi:hypothetical protein